MRSVATLLAIIVAFGAGWYIHRSPAATRLSVVPAGRQPMTAAERTWYEVHQAQLQQP